MKKIGIIFAMNKELELFAYAVSDFTKEKGKSHTFYHGILENCELFAAVSGIGKVNAALCAADLIETFAPDFILNIGISGGLSDKLHIGGYIIGSDIVYHDVWCGEPNAYGQIQEFPALYHSAPELCEKLSGYPQGLICCGDKFITQTGELAAISRHFPEALAVDMESAAIAQTCYIYSKPLLCLRQISDIPGHPFSEQQYADFWKNAAQQTVNLLPNLIKSLSR
ncbi:MAG: 5'-methylthioadenosine/S-adenosylhomocysteine nucleosidase [Alphaproteobacteria bacterium]|nr:5'-methylthioadenosine/S-adenosylhomocysteine nucleosidase [Alphaproteobacteria bacterium]MDY4690012.1 5'-methylthioadenosine/S-adenosylhomocysteine nucleosidase [Alphaproteobacteria bacterium]